MKNIYSNDQIRFLGPQKETGKVKSSLIKLKPQPSFSSGSDGTYSFIDIPVGYYEAKKVEIDEIMKKFGYVKN